MVDPRIYRAFLVLIAFAVIVFGFSLQNQPRRASTTLAPGQYFSEATATMDNLARAHPNREPGSAADQGVARSVSTQLSNDSFRVSTQYFDARTTQGTRLLENVYASRPGIGSGEVVVVASRDSSGRHAGQDRAGLSGTAALLGLAQALGGESLDRSVLLVSTSGSVGAAGAAELARRLGGQSVDAVVVLGDLAGAEHRGPVLVPWSNSDRLTPPMLLGTLAAYVRQDAGIRTPAAGLGGQLARLAFPFALTQQSPLIAAGLPAVLLSVSGDAPAVPGEALAGGSQLTNLGTAVLQTVNALDRAPAVAAPSSYLIISGKLVPLWAVRLLALALILPVLATAVDALARTRRRGHSILRWVGWVLAGSVPFLVGLGALLLARVTNLLSAAPPGAVGAHAVDLTGGDAAVLGGVLVAMVLAHVLLRPLCLKAVASVAAGPGVSGRRPETPAADAAAVALTLVMTALTVVVWALDPFSALLLIPALHLWLWMAQPGVRSRRWTVMALALVALVPILPVLVYYANAYGLSPLGLLWSGALMVAGGALPIVPALYWAVALGCAAGALVIATRCARTAATAAEAPVTVRGPASYAGPGSLGGTESALRR